MKSAIPSREAVTKPKRDQPTNYPWEICLSKRSEVIDIYFMTTKAIQHNYNTLLWFHYSIRPIYINIILWD